MTEAKKYKAPGWVVRQFPYGVPPPNRKSKISEWLSVVSYLKSCTGVRAAICVSCFGAKLYDKNGNQYIVNGRSMGIEAVRGMVEKIRKINDGSN